MEDDKAKTDFVTIGEDIGKINKILDDYKEEIKNIYQNFQIK